MGALRSLVCSALVTAVALSFAPAPATLRRTVRYDSGTANEQEFTRQQALYDLVYVERLAPPETSAGGAFRGVFCVCGIADLAP